MKSVAKSMRHVLIVALFAGSSCPSCMCNDAQTLAAQFFNIINAGLLIITAQENREQKIAAASALITSMSNIAQAVLKDEPEDIKRCSLIPCSSQKHAKNYLFTYLFFRKQLEPRNAHEQID